MASPLLCKGPDFALERPGVARLPINLPIGLGDRVRPHQPSRIEIGEGGLAFPFLDPLAHPGGVNTGIDDQMRDMDALRAKLARRALRYSAQAEFGAGKGGIADPAAHSRSGAGKEDIAAAAPQHQARRLAAGPEASGTVHAPTRAD